MACPYPHQILQSPLDAFDSDGARAVSPIHLLELSHLISCSNDSTHTLNGHDSMALAEFTGFCSAQECEILPVYVPGGPIALGTYIASAMVQHGIHNGSQASVIEDETVWEGFLRRCGMNAYAAQSVVAAIRAPKGVSSSSPNKAGMFGLPGFLQMDHAERVRLFETLFGGTRVLERVSTAIVAMWG